MRNSYKYPINDSDFSNKLLAFTKKYTFSSFLISNKNNKDKYKQHQLIVALGAKYILKSDQDSFQKLSDFHIQHKDWIFGFLSYDLKNEIENLSSDNRDDFQVPNLLFYVPEIILIIKDNIVEVQSFLSEKEVEDLLNNIKKENVISSNKSNINLQFREEKLEYLQKIKDIKNHIQQGDIYEMNYCQELFAENASINPIEVFSDLNTRSKAPFSVFFNFDNHYLLCSSPERFLKKEGNKLISQPIKGTRKRGVNEEEDILLVSELENSEKDKSENVMITDLVRNDLSKTAQKASVTVEELFKVYTFERVHQMISTITSQLDEKYNFVDVLESSFPMGSMTGAPKLKSMQLIEKYETTKRSIFSAAFGYITPSSDFDFNVVIRSILYNDISKYISVMVGGAITINSDENQEYEECLIKAKAMRDVLNND